MEEGIARAGSGSPFILFYLDERLYGLPVSGVREILPMLEITPVPNAPNVLLGVINLRGSIIPVIDLRRKLKLAAREPDAATCLVVADVAGRPFGFLADRVTDCQEVGDISRPDESQASLPERRLIHGIGQCDGSIVVLLDVDRILSSADRKALKSL